MNGFESFTCFAEVLQFSGGGQSPGVRCSAVVCIDPKAFLFTNFRGFVKYSFLFLKLGKAADVKSDKTR